MKDVHEDYRIASLAWIEEFGGEPPGVCVCSTCTGESVSDLGPSLADLVLGASAWDR